VILFILPSRELAYQIFNQISMINCYLKTQFFRVKLSIGGLSLKEDEEGIQRLNPNIIVGNPE
jgi:superfamily II DNA/RNA helicase